MLLVANWKMAPDTLLEALMLAKETGATAKKNKIPLVICPPYIYTLSLQKKVALLGVQAVSPYIDMPHTGEISPRMLQKIGVSYAIVGHSERRQSLYENNTSIQQSVVHLTDKKITPIICVGEQTRDSKGAYLDFVKEQITSALMLLQKTKIKDVVFAYEPVWAIGKTATRPATPVECQEMVIFIRKTIADIAGDKVAAKVQVLYGGSVDEENAKSFLTEGAADGLLVGRVSTDMKKFTKLMQSII